MKKRAFIVIAILFAIGVAVAGFRGSGCGFEHRGYGDRFYKFKAMFRDLDLSKEQKSKIKESFFSLKESIITIKRDKSAYFKSNITKDGFDRDRFIKEYLEKSKKIAKIKADFYESVFNTLTKEQKDRLIKRVLDKND